MATLTKITQTRRKMRDDKLLKNRLKKVNKLNKKNAASTPAAAPKAKAKAKK